MTDYMVLRGTAERMQRELRIRLENEWHGATEHQRLIYKIERLDMFQEYIKLSRECSPTTK